MPKSKAEKALHLSLFLQSQHHTTGGTPEIEFAVK